MKPTWLGIAAVRLLSTPVLAQVASVVSSVTSEVSPITTDSSTQTASGSTASSTPTASNEPKVHLIKAGAGGFKFTPQEIHNVSVGDIVSWEFYPPDHSVARAEYGSACVPYEYTGIDKVGFWSETQWVNDTSQVCLSYLSRCPGYTNDHVDYLLQHHDQLYRTHLLLLCGTRIMYGQADGRRH